MPSKEEEALNALYRHARLCSWKYRKVNLALTNTLKLHGASGLRNLGPEHFKTIFLKQVKEGDPLVMDPNRQQCLDLVDLVKGDWFQRTKERLQEELDVIYPDRSTCNYWYSISITRCLTARAVERCTRTLVCPTGVFIFCLSS